MADPAPDTPPGEEEELIPPTPGELLEAAIYKDTAAALAKEPWEVEIFKQICKAMEAAKVQEAMYYEVLMAIQEEFMTIDSEFPGCSDFFPKGNEALARAISHVMRAFFVKKTSSRLARVIATEILVWVKPKEKIKKERPEGAPEPTPEEIAAEKEAEEKAANPPYDQPPPEPPEEEEEPPVEDPPVEDPPVEEEEPTVEELLALVAAPRESRLARCIAKGCATAIDVYVTAAIAASKVVPPPPDVPPETP